MNNPIPAVAGQSATARDKAMDFGAEFTANLPQLLKRLNISLAFTSYQAGRLMLVRSDGENLDLNYKSFPRPMGLTVTDDSLTLGIFTQVVKFQREDGLLEMIKRPLQRIEDDITAPRVKPRETEGGHADDRDGQELSDEQRRRRSQQRAYLEKHFAPVDERVDACFIARSSHYSGMINIHDIDWGDEGLWAVNSSFSCLCTLDPDYSFRPRWKPHFISELRPEDRCHLNGMTLRDGKPAYVTTFSKFDSPGMWRAGDKFDGTLMDVASNDILVDGLAMPHSPRWYRGRLYFCNSGLGQLCAYDPATGGVEVLAELPGFTRGMDFCGPLLFVGLSRLRKSDVSRPAPLQKRHDTTYSGIWVFNLDNNKEVASLRFTGDVDQIYDVAVLGHCAFPELIEPDHPRMRNHFCLPAPGDEDQ